MAIATARAEGVAAPARQGWGRGQHHRRADEPGNAGLTEGFVRLIGQRLCRIESGMQTALFEKWQQLHKATLALLAKAAMKPPLHAVVEMRGQADLPQILAALRPPSGLACRVDRGQENANEHRDDRSPERPFSLAAPRYRSATAANSTGSPSPALGSLSFISKPPELSSPASSPSMKSLTEHLTFNLPARMAFLNITPQVEELVLRSGIREGLCLINAMHITASVFINDDEPGLHEDYARWLEKLAPFDADPTVYRHNRTGEDNADAHLKRQVMGREVVVAVTAGRLDFGPWEQIFYGEFDGRRPKRVLVKVIGE